MRQDGLISLQRDILHTPVFGTDIVQGNPKDDAVVATVLSMKACVLMPGAPDATMRFLVESSIVSIQGRGPEQLPRDNLTGLKDASVE